MTGAAALLKSVLVAPSILSADFGRLREQVAEVLAAGARLIHVDVMDGHFVPPITVGPLVVEALAGAVHEAGGIVEAHLMIERPERHVRDFVSAGADSVTVHAEATPHLAYTANLVHELGACVGVAINPGSPVDLLAELPGAFELALCMTVNPGWGGQPFIEHSLQKLPRVRAVVGEEVAVEVDGGIDAHTAPLCAAAGARLFVAGSAIFGASRKGAHPMKGRTPRGGTGRQAGDPGEAYLEIARSVSAAAPAGAPRR